MLARARDGACFCSRSGTEGRGRWWACFGVVWIESPLFIPGTNWLIGELDGLTASWAGCWWYDMLDYQTKMIICRNSLSLNWDVAIFALQCGAWPTSDYFELNCWLVASNANNIDAICRANAIFDDSNIAKDALLDWSWELADRYSTSRLRLRSWLMSCSSRLAIVTCQQ